MPRNNNAMLVRTMCSSHGDRAPTRRPHRTMASELWLQWSVPPLLRLSFCIQETVSLPHDDLTCSLCTRVSLDLAANGKRNSSGYAVKYRVLGHSTSGQVLHHSDWHASLAHTADKRDQHLPLFLFGLDRIGVELFAGREAHEFRNFSRKAAPSKRPVD